MYWPEPLESSVNKNMVTNRLEDDFSQRKRFNRFKDSLTGTFARNCICKQPRSMELSREAEIPCRIHRPERRPVLRFPVPRNRRSRPRHSEWVWKTHASSGFESAEMSVAGECVKFLPPK